MNKFYIVILGLIIAVAFLIFSTNTNKQIHFESAKTRTISQNSFFLGKFKPKDIVKVQPDISGIIDSVYIEIGDKVRIGDKIALLKIIPSPQILQNAKREYRLMAVDFEQKKTTYQRDSTLFSKGVISKANFENSKLSFDSSLIELKASLNNLSIAKNGFAIKEGNSPNIVKATIGGTIIDVLVEEGVRVTERNTFNDGSTIATIANTNSFFFDFEVGETEINNIKIGAFFDISIKALEGEIIKGKVKQIKSVIGDNEKYSYLVSASIIGDVNHLRVGYSGLAEFELKRKENVLSIKEKNILFKGRKAFISILQSDGQVEDVEIETGLSDGIYTEILSGVTVQDKIKTQ